MGVGEDRLHIDAKQARDFKREAQGWVVLVGFNGDDGLARHAQLVAKLGLSPAFGGPQFSQMIDHMRELLRKCAVAPNVAQKRG